MRTAVRILLTACVLVVPVSLSAQTVHPCDVAPQTAPTKGTRIGWCHDRKDGATLYQQGQLGFKLIVSNQVVDLGAALVPVGAPSTAGFWYFETALPSGSRGEYQVSMVAYSAEGESLPSTAIVWQIGGPPSVPKNPRVK